MPDSNTPPTHKAVVTKHNKLLPKLAKMELSELRLLSYCLAHYDSRPGSEEKFHHQARVEFTSTVKDLLSIFPYMDEKSAYAVVRKAVKGINSKPFEETYTMPDGDEVEVLFYWFSGFRYYKKRGEFTFSLSQDIVYDVLNQDGNFTRFRLKDVYQFRSALTWKLYELLKQWAIAGRWPVDLDELRMSLGVPGKYPTWTNIKQWILDKSIKEINEQSDIIVRYEKKKRVRAVSGVVFFINFKEEEYRKKDPLLVGTIGDTNNDIRLLMKAGLNQTNAEYLSRLAADAGKDLSVFLERVLARYEAKLDENKPPKQAYVYKALYNEFAPSLFDNIEKKSVKITQDKQRKISNENNKYMKEVLACASYKIRESGQECSAIKPHTKKCMVCDRLTMG